MFKGTGNFKLFKLRVQTFQLIRIIFIKCWISKVYCLILAVRTKEMLFHKKNKWDDQL